MINPFSGSSTSLMNNDEMEQLDLLLSELKLNFNHSYFKRTSVIKVTTSQTREDQDMTETEGGVNGNGEAGSLIQHPIPQCGCGNEGCLGECEEVLLEVLRTNNLNGDNLAQAASNDVQGSSSGGDPEGSNNRGAGTFYERGSQLEIPICNCGHVAAQRVVQNEGPKKGHLFFVCREPNDRNQIF